jgi:hypothetical protein
MIGKQIKGTDFKKLLNYLVNKEGATQIGGNMIGCDPQELTNEFQFSCRLNPRVKRPVYHASLSLARHEYLEDEAWCAIAQDYLKGMQFDQNLYVVFRHTDREHDHVHIVASRVRLDGSCVHDGWDYRKSESLLRELEQAYDLTFVQRSWELEARSSTTGERRLLARTGEQSNRVQLQQIIDQATVDNLTLPEFIERLQVRGINVRTEVSQPNKGISYELKGMHFSGTQLGKAYTFPGLQKYRGVSYESERDDHQIQTQSQDRRKQKSNRPVIEIGTSREHQRIQLSSPKQELEL